MTKRKPEKKARQRGGGVDGKATPPRPNLQASNQPATLLTRWAEERLRLDASKPNDVSRIVDLLESRTVKPVVLLETLAPVDARSSIRWMAEGPLLNFQVGENDLRDTCQFVRVLGLRSGTSWRALDVPCAEVQATSFEVWVKRWDWVHVGRTQGELETEIRAKVWHISCRDEWDRAKLDAASRVDAVVHLVKTLHDQAEAFGQWLSGRGARDEAARIGARIKAPLLARIEALQAPDEDAIWNLLKDIDAEVRDVLLSLSEVTSITGQAWWDQPQIARQVPPCAPLKLRDLYVLADDVVSVQSSEPESPGTTRDDWKEAAFARADAAWRSDFERWSNTAGGPHTDGLARHVHDGDDGGSRLPQAVGTIRNALNSRRDRFSPRT